MENSRSSPDSAAGRECKGFYENKSPFLSMKSDSSGSSELERTLGKAAVEAARMAGQASQVAKKILNDMSAEAGELRGYDSATIDLMETDEELIAYVCLPGASKDKIDLRVTEDSLYVEAKAAAREGRYVKRETSTSGMKREIKLPVEIKPEQVKAGFENGILMVRLPKLVIMNAQRITVD